VSTVTTHVLDTSLGRPPRASRSGQHTFLPGGRGHLPGRGSRRPLPRAAGPQPLCLPHLSRQL